MNKMSYENLKRLLFVIFLGGAISTGNPQEKITLILNGLTANNDYPKDLVVDSEGNTHVVFVHVPIEGVDTTSEQQLIYAKFSRDGSSIGKSAILLSASISRAKLGLNSKNEALVFYSTMWWTGFMQFNKSLIPKAVHRKVYGDAEIKICMRADDYVYVIMNGGGGFGVHFDPDGQIIRTVTRFNRQGGFFPGYNAEVLSTNTLLATWPVWDETSKKKEGHIGYVLFDDSLKHLFKYKEAKLSEIAEAEYLNIPLSEIVMVRNGEQVIAYVPERKSTDEVVTYKVRFNSKGEPIKGQQMIRISPKGINVLSMAKRQIRFAILKDKNGKLTEGSYLYGFTTDGEIAYEENVASLKIQR